MNVSPQAQSNEASGWNWNNLCNTCFYWMGKTVEYGPSAANLGISAIALAKCFVLPQAVMAELAFDLVTHM